MGHRGVLSEEVVEDHLASRLKLLVRLAALKEPELQAEDPVFHSVWKPCSAHLERRDNSTTDKLLENHRAVHKAGDLLRVGLDTPDEEGVALLKSLGERLELMLELLPDRHFALGILWEKGADVLVSRSSHDLSKVGQQRVARLRDEVLHGVGDVTSVVLDLEALLEAELCDPTCNLEPLALHECVDLLWRAHDEELVPCKLPVEH
mmetsp:Transcript_38082/g.83641  ORF Transcript_38082/g.83641 Transcript_38082/m.83641 type:complete len:206 (-) Transcript_38082:1801-2418(-)